MKTEQLTQWADAGLYPSENAMRDHLLIGLLQEGTALPPDYPELLAKAGLHFPGDYFALIELKVVAVDAYSYIRGLGHTAYSDAQLAVHISELLRERLARQPEVFVFKIQSEIMCLLSADTSDGALALQKEVCALLLAMEGEIDGVRFLAALSDVCPGFFGIREEKQQVKQIFEYRALHLGLPPAVSYQEMLECLKSLGYHAEMEKERAVLSAFKTGHYRQAMELFGSLFDEEYLSLADPLMLLKRKCAQYIYALADATREICGDDPDMTAISPELRLLTAGSYSEVRAQMEHIFGRLNDLVLAHQRDDGSAEWISAVKDYIRGHYTDPDLNVNKLAEVFGRNPSYLSRRFLRLTGQSVLDYIHRYRVQEAKIRIGQGTTLAVVAQQVGYSSVLTMSRAFKKYEGTTPGKLKNG